MEELVTALDPCHVEARSCVEATAMIIDSLGISSFVLVISLSEVERARFLVPVLIPPVRRFSVMQVYALRPVRSATFSLLFGTAEPGVPPGA